jgi:hypothetical protein
MHARGGTIMRGESKASPIGQNFAGTMWWLLTDWLWKVVGPKGR